jgi:hypothetical protein
MLSTVTPARPLLKLGDCRVSKLKVNGPLNQAISYSFLGRLSAQIHR